MDEQVSEGQCLAEHVIETDALIVQRFQPERAGHGDGLVGHDVVSPGGHFSPARTGGEARGALASSSDIPPISQSFLKEDGTENF